MNFNHIFVVFLLGLSTTTLFGQSPCNNPISIGSILIANSTCGNSSGTIIITPAGGGAFTFDWTPSVSSTNVAFNLAAGLYQVHLTRANDPDCTLDTSILVNNGDGPIITATIDPADCLASSGSITVQPSQPQLLQYTWSNGAVTNVNQGLASGNYYVTATDPNTGCFSITKIFMPRDNTFNVTANVTKHAKCGKNIGSVQILVPQGSGNYSYSLGNGPVFNDLAAGNYTCTVTDNVTGCTGSVSFAIQNQPVIGIVDVSTKNVRCAGEASGLVEFQVIPVQNFQLPFIFNLVNTSGVQQSPGSLVAGTYYLQVFDADMCPLPPDTFSIQQPPPIVVQSSVSPEDCLDAGAISLTISGGTGANYTVNWLDMPGDINPEDREQIEAGLYSAFVYDSLFCRQNVDNLLVAPQCSGIDTVHMVVKFNSTDFYCYPIPPGLGAAGATTFSLLGGGTASNSSYGSWNLDPNGGCLAYSAGPNPGFALDTICMVRTASQIGLKDTLCLIVSISTKQPSKQSIFFTVQTGGAIETCGNIPATYTHNKIVQLGRHGLSGASDAFGHYTINPLTGCISFFANSFTGFSVDEIRVAAFDTVLNECHIICYLPSIIEAVDCGSVINLPANISITANDCSELAVGCIPIPYDDIVNYSIIDNGALYNSGFVGCNFENTISYTITSLPQGGGPYQLTEWTINSQTQSGSFLNLAGLATLMTSLDPGSNWDIQGANFIRGGNLGNTYGPLKIKSAAGATATFNPVLQQVAQGTELRFDPGIHKVVFRHVLNACSDTLIVTADCIDCHPIHSYPSDAQGNIVWLLSGACSSDTVFCTEILQSNLANYTITDNQQSNVELTDCGNKVGMVLDTGFHLIHVRDTTGDCEYYIRFYLLCNSQLPGDSLNVTLAVGEQTRVCLDTIFLPNPIISISNLCENDGANTLFSYQYVQGQWCVDLTGLSLGQGNLCLLLCNASGQCASYMVHITVAGAISDSLQAVPDKIFTLISTEVDIPILANDIVKGVTGNKAAVANVEFLSSPQLGGYIFDPFSGILTYLPNPAECGTDSFFYRITDTLGQRSQTSVCVTIACDKILVFNGISPNGDDKNDTWHILGIEQFPGNEVRVFNRWGNQVFEQKGYNNDNAWDGTWNGKALPDGTYFYLVNLGGQAGRFEGYLQILR
jgi:gliding motility-associated-like protein